jgi:hypothetical protein
MESVTPTSDPNGSLTKTLIYLGSFTGKNSTLGALKAKNPKEKKSNSTVPPSNK